MFYDLGERTGRAKRSDTWLELLFSQNRQLKCAGVTELFLADKSPKKINLGVGAYRDENGKPYVLPSVRTAEDSIIKSKYDKEYLPITGFGNFTKQAAVLAYGKDSKPLKEDRIAITQSISGTGALRIGGAFLERFYTHSKAIYLPTPSWGNHVPIFKDSGLEVKQYRYYDKKSVGLDFKGMLDDLKVRFYSSELACD